MTDNPPGLVLTEVVDVVMAENERRWMEKQAEVAAWTPEQAQRIWDTGEAIHRNSVEWTLSVLLDLGYRVLPSGEMDPHTRESGEGGSSWR